MCQTSTNCILPRRSHVQVNRIPQTTSPLTLVKSTEGARCPTSASICQAGFPISRGLRHS